MTARNSTLIATAIFTLVVAYLLPFLSKPFFTHGEAREALVVQAMVQQNNLVLPLRNGVAIPSKPPLFHWAAYAGAANQGNDALSEVFVRLPSAIASALAVAAFFLLFNARQSTAGALFGVLMLFTSLDWLRTSATARVDLMFSLWTSLATWLLFLAVEAEGNRGLARVRWFLLAGVAMGLATLAKGPAGIALPVAVAGLYTLISKTNKIATLLFMAVSALVAFYIAVPWYLNAYWQGGERFLDVHLMRENLARVVGMEDYHTGHESSPFSVVGMIASGLLPWTAFFPVVCERLWKQRRHSAGIDPAMKFCLIWACFYLVFFAFTASKRNVYLLPSYPAYAYIFTCIVSSVVAKNNVVPIKSLRITGWICMAIAAALSLSAVLIYCLPHIDYHTLLVTYNVKPREGEVVTLIASGGIALPIGVLVTASLLGIGTNHILKGHLQKAVAFIASGQLILAYVLNFCIMDRLAETQSPKAELASLLAEVPVGSPLFQFQQDLYTVDFYANRVIKTIVEAPVSNEAQSGYVLVTEREAESARRVLPSSEIVAKSTGRILYGKDRLLLMRFAMLEGDGKES